MADTEKKIDKLTPEQEAAIPNYQVKWRSIGHSTSPTNRQRAEEGMLLSYKAANTKPPQTVIWFGSFLAGAVAAALFKKLPENTPNLTGIANETVNRFMAGERNLRLSVEGVGQLTIDDKDIRETLDTACYGQHDASWLGFYDFFERECGIDASPLHGLMILAEEAGWWWPFEGACILTDKPTSVKLDERDRLHCGDGPAVTYPDGFSLYLWHGIQVPEMVIMRPNEITPDMIEKELNAELRRVKLERFGLEKYLKAGNAKLIHEDKFGKLWQRKVPNDDPVTMVEVVNSTPEPTGEFKHYMLPVPPTTRTAKGGIAWTFNMSEEDFNPQVET